MRTLCRAADETTLPQIALGKHSHLAADLRGQPVQRRLAPLGVRQPGDARLLHARADPQDAAALPGGGDQLLAVGRRQSRALPAAASTRAARCTSSRSRPASRIACPALAKGGCIGVAHHGEVTDSLFKTGQARRGPRLPQAGPRRGPAGRRLHPHARRGRRRRVEGLGPRLLHDLRLRAAPQRGGPEEAARPRADPRGRGLPRRATRRGCSRRCSRPSGPAWPSRSWPPAGSPNAQEWVEQAFRETFAAIKPSDGVIVGIYDRYSDQAGRGRRASSAASAQHRRVKDRRTSEHGRSSECTDLRAIAAARVAVAGSSPVGRRHRLPPRHCPHRRAHAAGNDTIRIGFVGCGNRGTGACREALSTKGPVQAGGHGRPVRRAAGTEPEEPAEVRGAAAADRRARRAAGSSASTPTRR